MNLRLLSVLVATVALGLPPLSAVVVGIDMFGIGKTKEYTQTGPTTVTFTSNDFNTFVNRATNGTLNAAVLVDPSSTNTTLNNRSRGLGLNKKNSSDPDGAYKLNIDTDAPNSIDYSNVSLTVAPDGNGKSFPTEIPTFTLDNGSWNNGIYLIDPAQNTNFGWNFASYVHQASAPTDAIIFTVESNDGSTEVAYQVFQGANAVNGYTLNAGSFQPGQQYNVNVTFAHIVAESNVVPGAQGVAFFATSTSFTLQAVPEPSTYALLALGLGVVALPVLRRRSGARR